MQKYELSRQTHKMTIVLRLKLYKILLFTARIAYENTYDMRGKINPLLMLQTYKHIKRDTCQSYLSGMFRLPGWVFWLLIFLATKTHQRLDDAHQLFFWSVGTIALCDIVQYVQNTAVYVRRPNETRGQPGYFDVDVPENARFVCQLPVVPRHKAQEMIFSNRTYSWILLGGEEARYCGVKTPCSISEHCRTSCLQFKTNYTFTTSKGRENAEAANWCLLAVYLITLIVTVMQHDGFLQDDTTDLLLMGSWIVMWGMQRLFDALCETTVVFNSLSLTWVLFNRIMVSTNNGFVFVFPFVMALMEVPCFRKACVFFFRLDWSWLIFNVAYCCFTVTLFLAKFMIEASRVVKSSVHDYRYLLAAAGLLFVVAFVTVERKAHVYWSLLKLFCSKIFGLKVFMSGGLISTVMQAVFHCMSEASCVQNVIDYCTLNTH